MQELVSVLPASGAEMEFSAFVAAARAAGFNPQRWLAAKHAGLIEARINEQGQHLLKRAPSQVGVVQ